MLSFEGLHASRIYARMRGFAAITFLDSISRCTPRRRFRSLDPRMETNNQPTVPKTDKSQRVRKPNALEEPTNAVTIMPKNKIVPMNIRLRRVKTHLVVETSFHLCRSRPSSLTA